VGFGIVVFHATQFRGVALVGVESGQHNRLIASEAGRFVDGMGIQSAELEIGFGSDHEER